ncbi:MAG: hypothetical protein AB1552_14195 [Nitrospirota bacterium]
MAGKHKGHLGLGIVLAISFLVVLVLIFSPVFPKAPDGSSQNGLEYADRMFNRLAKGSSYFIPKVLQNNEEFMGKMINITIKMDKPDDKPGDAEKRAELASKLLIPTGARTEVMGPEIKMEGDLGKILESALQDSDAMFKNNGEQIRAKYADAMSLVKEEEQKEFEKKMFRQWHTVLAKMDKEFKKEKMVPEAKICSDVMKKAVEAAYNFYGIEAQKVIDHVGMMTTLLVFYVAYTMWWGYAIFFIFEGIGLSMKKAKVKKEV